MTVRKTLLALCALLVVAVAALVLWPQKVRVGHADDVERPEEVELTGIIRDFHRVHPDFDAIPPEGLGHSAGSVDLWLSAARRPVFTGAGVSVVEEWRDSAGRPIAPHLAGVVGGPGGGGGPSLGVRVDGDIELKSDAVIDAFSSGRGPYGINGNYGTGAVVSTNAVETKAVKIHDKVVVWGDMLVGPGGSPAAVIDNDGIITGSTGTLDEPYVMPDFEMPEFGPPQDEHVHLEGPVTFGSPDTVTELHYGFLHLKDHTAITVYGDVIVRCDVGLKIEKTEITIMPDATLTFYVDGDVDLKKNTLITAVDTSSTAFLINVLGDHKIKCEDKTHVYGTIVAPEARLEIKKDGHLYGAYVGRELKVESKGGLHVDTDSATEGPWNFAVTLRDKMELEDHAFVDSFDSNLGPYDEVTNSGDDARLSTNTVKHDHVKIKKHATVEGDVLVGAGADPHYVIKLEDHAEVTGIMGSLIRPLPVPFISPPPMGPSIGDLEYENGSFVLTGDVRCKKLKIKKAVLEIDGDVTIRCDDKLEIKDRGELQLRPGSRLTLYVTKEIKIEDRALLNTVTGNPQLVSIRMMSLGKTGKIEIKKHSQAVAWIQGARSEMKVEDQSEFFGSFTGEKMKVKKSKFHVDMAYLNSCIDIDDVAGEAGDDANGGITSAETFGQWFRDILGTNQSMAHKITLIRTGDVYEFIDDAFHPIDGRLYGNEGQTHNNHFTFVLKADFVYPGCDGRFVELEGGDGLWAYVNGMLVTDLGGVDSETPQRIELDRLGLTEGSPGRLEIFHAQRQSARSRLRLRTNLLLSTDGIIPSVNAQYD